ncbi:MAG: hypothetical protein ACI4PF_05870 [Christensenellales bacterium]
MSELTEQWRKESLELVESSTPTNNEDKRCVVKIKVDSVGAISAMVYAPRGIAYAEVCYSDTSKRPYGLRLSFLDLKRVIAGYSKASNIPADQVRTDDANFISWITTLMEQQKLWDETHASWTGGFFQTYETKTEALKALWSGECFNQDPNCKNKEVEDDLLP